MSREIKFLAWEKNLKEVIPVHDINFETQMINTESAWRLFNEIELMQFTGLRDKNGVEVYEGYIVKRLDWDQDYIVAVDRDRTGFYLHDRSDREDDHMSMLLLKETKCVVVGNIYENMQQTQANVDCAYLPHLDA